MTTWTLIWTATATGVLLVARRLGLVDRTVDLAVDGVARIDRWLGGDLAAVMVLPAVPVAVVAAAERHTMLAAVAALVAMVGVNMWRMDMGRRVDGIEAALRQRAVNRRDLEAVRQATLEQVRMQLQRIDDLDMDEP